MLAKIMKGAGILTACCGIMAIEAYDMLGMWIALAGFGLALAGMWYEMILEVRWKTRRRNAEWRRRN